MNNPNKLTEKQREKIAEDIKYAAEYMFHEIRKYIEPRLNEIVDDAIKLQLNKNDKKGDSDG